MEAARELSRSLAYGSNMDQEPKPRPKRDAPISVRIPRQKLEGFRADVASSGKSTNAYILAAVLGEDAPKSRNVPSIDQQSLALLRDQAARIADKLRRMTGSVRDPFHAVLIEQCRDELAEIRTVLFTLQGRQP